ncbi:hypothetical protein V8G54_000621 [Vigna mungo]|uniref:Uncharacterized protein n=1 Tax=Vigna mungo TaxID=3915 RepID=A0AAQ3P777_VIGMU
MCGSQRSYGGGSRRRRLGISRTARAPSSCARRGDEDDWMLGSIVVDRRRSGRSGDPSRWLSQRWRLSGGDARRLGRKLGEQRGGWPWFTWLVIGSGRDDDVS